MAAVADALVGTTVGRYRLVGVLGKGGMGCVYEAVHQDNGNRVAIKVIFEIYAGDPDMALRFFSEASNANTIQHEGIVKVLDVVAMPDRRPAIVMELVEGSTLREAASNGVTSLRSVLEIIAQVLDTVAAAHAAGIIHRDLKPDNILVTRSGRAKVLDFGIAKMLNPGKGHAVPRTRTGAAIGTPEYMAPEQISGAAVDARTDIYAIGVLLFEAITGRRPFEAPNDFELMRAHLEHAPPSMRTWAPNVPDDVEHVVEVALAKDPDARFQQASAMAAALRTAASRVADDAMPGRGGRLDAATAPVRRGGSSDASVAATVAERQGELASGREPVASMQSAPTRPPARRLPLLLAGGVAVVIAAAVFVVPRLVRPRVTAQTTPAQAPPDAAITSGDAVVARMQGPEDAANQRASIEDAAITEVVADMPRDAGPPSRRSSRVDAAVRVADDKDSNGEAQTPAPSSGSSASADSDAPSIDSKGSRASGVFSWDDERHQHGSAQERYNGHHVDAMAMLPKAKAVAKQAFSDAALSGVMADGATADGFIDLDPELCCYSASLAFDFVVSGNQCLRVTFSRSGYVAAFTMSGTCAPRTPRCTVRQIWAKAKAAGFAEGPATTRAQVEFNTHDDGKWSFSTEDTKVGQKSLPDDC